MWNEKPIDSSASIHSVGHTLIEEKEKDKSMERGRGKGQRELQKELNRKIKKWKGETGLEKHRHKCDRLCINRPFTAKCKFSVRTKIEQRTQYVNFAFMS